MNKVFTWMGLGLTVTAVSSLPFALLNIYPLSGIGLVLWIIAACAEFGLVYKLSNREISNKSPLTTATMFIAYSALTGFTLSPLFSIYSLASMFSTFLITAGMFLIMSFAGVFIRYNMEKAGPYLFMALIGLIIATFVNIFWASSALYWITTYVGIIVFVLLTAWDANMINRRLKSETPGTASYNNMVIGSALSLYLDFINMFLYLLRIFGEK